MAEDANKDLALVRSTGCQWLGDSTEYCGSRDLVDMTCYCKLHWPRMHREGTRLRKRKKDIRIANQVWDLESLFNEAVEELTLEGVL